MTDTLDGIPRLVPGLDVRTLPLSALEGFVLSRIDGRSGLGELVALTGLPDAQVVSIVMRLVALGAVALPTARSVRPEPAARPSQLLGEATPRRRATASFPAVVRGGSERPSNAARVSQTPAAPPDPAPPVADVAPPAPAASADAPEAAAPALPSAPPPDSLLAPEAHAALYDPAELDEDIDLPRERRVQVLERFYRLGSIDHYALLGVPESADKREVRAAYFGLSKAFHPDTMFRKNLGSYKAKMVRVFEALTEAYETLSKNKSRGEYDAYLAASRTAARAERAMVLPPLAPFMGVPGRAPAASPAEVPAPEAKRTPEVPVTAAPSTRAPEAATREPARGREPSEVAVPPSRIPTDEARRLAQEVIARRLRGVIRPAMPTPDEPVAKGAAGAGEPANPFDVPPKTDARQLLSRLTRTLKDVGQLTGGEDRIVRAVRMSQAALDRGDLSEATQQIARAATLAPERTDLRAEHQRLSQKLAANMGDTWKQQAEFEMKHGKWASAAMSWAKVCEGNPSDAAAHRQAATALLKAGGDLRGAQKYAQKAVFLAPSDIEARVLLAQIYLTAGLKLNARRELQAATTLDPANEMVKNLLAELKG